MSGYILESGGMIEQNRYVELQKRLQIIGHDRRRRGLPNTVLRKENLDMCESQILDMFWDSTPIFGNAIHQQMQYFGHSLRTSQRGLKRLREKGILCLDGRSYRLLDLSSDAPMEIGAPIVFLPGTKSQKTGHIVEMRELKSGPGGIHPIAVLSTGQTMFVNPETAKVDVSQTTLEDRLQWLLSNLITAVSRETAVPASVICLKAFRDGIPQPSKLIKTAVQSGKIRRGHMASSRQRESIYWKNL